MLEYLQSGIAKKGLAMSGKDKQYGVSGSTGSDLETYTDGTVVGTTAFCVGGSNTWDIFQENTDKVLGKVLTIIDASYTDPQQRDAVKSLIKGSFREHRKPGNWTVTYGQLADSTHAS